MSTPLGQQQPPPVGVNQQTCTASTGHGSVGSVIAVLAVITILGVMAGVIGRLCSGRPILGHGDDQYDFEGWVERKCSSCLDGRVDRPPPLPREEVQVTLPAEETQQEIKEEEHAGAQVEGQKQHGSSSES